MTSSPPLSDRLRVAIDLAKAVQSQPDAHRAFQEVLAELRPESPVGADLLELLWQEYVGSQRSSIFWEQMSEVEKNLSDRLSESHVQLKQNYLRLMQEQ